MTGFLKALMSGADRLARVASVDGPINVDDLLRSLERRHGCRASPSQRQALDELLKATAEDAQLTVFGRQALRWDLCRLLRNGQRVEEALRLQQTLAQAPVLAPIIILGLPRTGSSFLHRLLAEDHENAVVRCWQTLDPAPRPNDFDATTDAGARRVERSLNLFRQLAPDLTPLHPLGADLPQECTEITAHTFRSYVFDTMFRVPGYLDWLDREGHAEAYAFHRQFLQFLQAGVARRWVLKCPDHVFSLPDLLATYPDARLIVTHRDPMAVMPSVARLTQVLREPFSRRVEPHEVGAEIVQRWIEGAKRMVTFEHRHLLPATRVFHLRFTQLISDPLTTVLRIYRHFELPLDTTTMNRMRKWIDDHPRGGYGRVQHSLESFGLRRNLLEHAFSEYRQRFGLAPRPAPRHALSRGSSRRVSFQR